MTQALTIESIIACAERELSLRKNVYAKRVADGKMKQDHCDMEIANMQGLLKLANWHKANRQRMELAMNLLKLFEAHPGGWNLLFADDAVKAVLDTFPAAQVKAIRALDPQDYDPGYSHDKGGAI